MEKFSWEGRIDGTSESHLRLHQHIKQTSIESGIPENSIVLHAFACDEGVARNKGRIGAALAPNLIRKHLSNSPIHNPSLSLIDAGDIACTDGNLEMAQTNLSEKVCTIISKKSTSMLLGGGHELTYGHFSGVKKAFPNAKIGIINIDAHWDNREIDPKIGATSGTGFWQIATENTINSLHIGIQKNSNTKHLFDFAKENQMQYIPAEKFNFNYKNEVENTLNSFISNIDVLYLTLCMDVFNAAIAPGVSALAYNGLYIDAFFLEIYHQIISSKKLVAVDVAEVNPLVDENEKTARLAAFLMNEVLMR